MSLQCPKCDGSGRLFVHLNTIDPRHHGFQWIDCDLCAGAGEIGKDVFDRFEAGLALREERRKRGLTLRQEAGRLGITAMELSRRERGMS